MAANGGRDILGTNGNSAATPPPEQPNQTIPVSAPPKLNVVKLGPPVNRNNKPTLSSAATSRGFTGVRSNLASSGVVAGANEAALQAENKSSDAATRQRVVILGPSPGTFRTETYRRVQSGRDSKHSHASDIQLTALASATSTESLSANSGMRQRMYSASHGHVRRLLTTPKSSCCSAGGCSACWHGLTEIVKKKVVFFFPEVSPFKKFLTSFFSLGAAWVDYAIAVELVTGLVSLFSPVAAAAYGTQATAKAIGGLSALAAAYFTQKTIGTNFKDDKLYADRFEGLSDDHKQLRAEFATFLTDAVKFIQEAQKERELAAKDRQKAAEDRKTAEKLLEQSAIRDRIMDGVLAGLALWKNQQAAGETPAQTAASFEALRKKIT